MSKSKWDNQHVHTCSDRPNDFCNACYQIKYRKDNRRALVTYHRRTYAEKKDEINAKRREKYRQDPIHRKGIKDRGAAYYTKNKEKILQKQIGTRHRSNPGGSRHTYWSMVISLLIQRDGDKCALCGLPVFIETASIDHIKEIRNGTDHSAENIRLTHRQCNMRRPRIGYKPHNFDYLITDENHLLPVKT